MEMVGPALVASAARHGIALELILPAFDQVVQEAMNPHSMINSSKPDAVLFALDYRALPLKISPSDATAAAAHAQAEMLRSAILDALAHEFKTPLATILTAAGGLSA